MMQFETDYLIMPTHLHSHLSLLPNTQATQAKSKKSASHRTRKVQTFVQTLTDIAMNVNRFGQNECKLDTTHLRADRRATDNKVLPKAGVTCFYDTFVLNQTLVFQINSSPETPRLRQYPNR